MQTGPNTPPRHQIEAVVTLYNKGEFDAAFDAAAALAAKFPSAAFLHNILGAISAKKGKQEDAIASFRRAVAAEPRFPDAHNNLGVALKGLGNNQEALEHYARAIELKPDYAEAYYNLANALRDLGGRENAVANYAIALRLAPNHHRARNNLGLVLHRLERYEEAVLQFRTVLAADPGFIDAYNNLGLTLKALGREDEALASFAKAIEARPDNARPHYNLGSFYFDLGHKQEAAESYARALRIQPDFAEAYRSLGAVKRYAPDDPHIAYMKAMTARTDIADDDRMQWCYALGKASEDLGEYDAAFGYYAEANALRKKALRYDPQVERDMFQKIKAGFHDCGPKDALRATHGAPLRRTPIFIVGMPRSGTSLTEHILASHSQVFGAGELMTLGKAVTACWSGGRVDAAQLAAIRSMYLSDLDRRNPQEPFVADKMHLNYRWIGMICMAIPEAKIVHIKRRSIASCWSIFKYYFSDFGNGYAYSLEDVAEYYAAYMDMMQFWNARFPGAIYNFSYDRLTEDQETETQKLLAYLGLEMEQSCIDFHETKRAVATISSMQVRRKLYQGSSDEWRKYEKFLTPFIERFGVE